MSGPGSKLFIALAGLLMLLAAGAAPALSERRVALVVGNNAYEVAPLDNPVNDANAVAQTLESAGFEVTKLLDATQRDLNLAIINFGNSLTKDAIGLFYYAGHGVQVRGRNYMIPIGAAIEVEDHVEVEGVDLAKVLGRMGGARNRLNIVIMDSCRDNPFKETFRFATQGLAETPAPPGTYISYAAAPGQVAFDGTGSNSIYTGALVNAIKQPGKKIEEVFKVLRTKVRQVTEGAQVPWTSSSLTEEFYFFAAATEEEPAKPGRRAAKPGQEPDDIFLAIYRDRDFWKEVKDSDDPEALEAYLEEFPKGTYARLARLRLKKLRRPEKTSPKQDLPKTKEVAKEPEAQLKVAAVDVKAKRAVEVAEAKKAAGKWYAELKQKVDDRREREAEEKLAKQRAAAKQAKLEADRMAAEIARLEAET